MTEETPKKPSSGFTFRLSVFITFVLGGLALGYMDVRYPEASILGDILVAYVTLGGVVLGGSTAIAARNGK